MAIITAHRVAPDLLLQIDSLGSGLGRLDEPEARELIESIEKAIGGSVQEITLVTDAVCKLEKIKLPLSDKLAAIFRSADHYRPLLPGACLTVHLRPTGQPIVQPDVQGYPATLESKLALACQNWWRRNRGCLTCVTHAVLKICYNDESVVDATALRVAVVEKLAVACARYIATHHEGPHNEIEDIVRWLAEYSAVL